MPCTDDMKPLARHMRQDQRVVRLCILAATLLCGGRAVHAKGPGQPLKQTSCSVQFMVEDLRAGLKSGSPAYRRYLRTLFREASVGLPLDDLRIAFESERDPEIVEILGSSLAARAGRMNQPALIKPVLDRATRDGNPALRAAAIRGLRGTGAVETMSKVGTLDYPQLMRDGSREVREAVAGNLLEDSSKVYFGHDRATSEQAIAAAQATSDPDLAAKLLSEVSTEAIGHHATNQILDQLHGKNETVRAAAAKALGGVPGSESAGVQNELLDLYRADSDPAVRKAVLESLARLGLSGAIPTLESLRSIDPRLSAEIDTWIKALRLNLQEWSLVEREWKRLQK